MTREELKVVLKGALVKDASVNFADREEAAKKALFDYYGVNENTSYRELKKLGFEVLTEVIDEVVPAQLENIMGGFATIKTFARNEEVVYEVKGLGKRRALLSIVPGARAGIYKAKRLDNKFLSIRTRLITAGVFVNLEEILLGKASLGDLMANILQGIQYEIYKDIVKAMRTIKTQAPAANRTSAAGLKTTELDKLIRIVGAYGRPVIVGFHNFVVNFNNMVGVTAATPNIPVQDLDEIRNKGFVSIYKGTPIIEIPNFILDETTNDKWAFSEADAFILPVDEKPVIVAFQGDGYTEEITHNLGGASQNYHRMMGTAILAYNNLGVYTDTTIASSEEAGRI